MTYKEEVFYYEGGKTLTQVAWSQADAPPLGTSEVRLGGVLSSLI